MNDLIIERAESNYRELLRACDSLFTAINMNFSSINKLEQSETEKKIIWKTLEEEVNNIILSVEKILNELESLPVQDYCERREQIINDYKGIFNKLNEEKGVIVRQVKKKSTILAKAPIQRKELKEGQCYFCDSLISDNFSYKIPEEEQKVFNIEVQKGTEFCSRDCLRSFCNEYDRKEKVWQKEGQRIKEKINRGKILLASVQRKLISLRQRDNKLERKKREIEELQEDDFFEKKKNNDGFFKSFFKKIGFIKRDELTLDEIKQQQRMLRREIYDTEERIKRESINLTIDKQQREEWDKWNVTKISNYKALGGKKDEN